MYYLPHDHQVFHTTTIPYVQYFSHRPAYSSLASSRPPHVDRSSGSRSITSHSPMLCLSGEMSTCGPWSVFLSGNKVRCAARPFKTTMLILAKPDQILTLNFVHETRALQSPGGWLFSHLELILWSDLRTMRLLHRNSDGGYSLTEFIGDAIPR